ncbi:MAG: response regulator [Crinalium sp.]
MAKILIVDDSSMSRRMLRNILEKAGHQAIEAKDGISAIEAYFLNHPDLVLLDLVMEGMYGLDVLEKLRQLDSTVQVIIASADIQKSTRETAQTAGAKAFVNKPFASANVLEVVNTVLKGSGIC